MKDALIVQVVELLDPFATDFEFRYVKIGLKHLPLEAVESAVADLMAAVRPHCEATVSAAIPDIRCEANVRLLCARSGRSISAHYAREYAQTFLVVAIEGAPFDDYMPQRKAGVCTGASQRRFISSSSIDTVTEQPAISSDVTKLPTSDRVTMLPAGSSNRRTTSYIR